MAFKRLTSRVLAVALAGAVALPAAVSIAEAGDGHRNWRNNGGQHKAFRHRGNRGGNHGGHRGNRRGGNDVGAAVALGVIGLATGAIIGGALSAPRAEPEIIYDPRYPRHYGSGVEYFDPADRRAGYRPSAPVVEYDVNPAPYSGEWYRYCAEKYRSFNPRTGTYTTYSGEQRVCR
jgi:hypothetical protein